MSETTLRTYELRKKVQVWILRKSETKAATQCLILQTTPERGQFWQPVTGSVDAGETFLAAAIRETLEETGLNHVVLEDLKHGFVFESKFGPAWEQSFYCTVSEAFTPKLDAHEHTHFKWVSIDEALTLLKYDTNKSSLLLALQQPTFSQKN